MKNADSRLVELFKSYLSGTCSDEERKEFLMLAIAPKFKEKLLELIENELNNDHAGSEELISHPDILWQRIVGEVKIREQEISTQSTNFSFRKIWWAAAAAILLPAIILTFVFVKNGSQGQLAENGIKKSNQVDISPGGNKALLILSDDSSILLDTAKTGLIIKQGNANISKIGEGALAYNSVSNKKAETLYNTVVTPRGGQYQLRLPDGSNVWLNAASSIKFPTSFAGGRRIVEITGEVFFEVEHNPSKPFVVKTGQAEIEVLGTKFNVNTYNLKTPCATTLVEGSLKLINTAKKESQILKPGQQAFINEYGGINLQENADIETTIAWKNGYFQFKDTELEIVMQQISRWYNVEVNYEKKPDSIRLTGIISRKVNASSILQMLELSGVNVSIEDNIITVK